jgi:RNA polymerase sigma factor (sigma-70 family)
MGHEWRAVLNQETYDKYYKMVYHIAYKKAAIFPHHDIEDLVQAGMEGLLIAHNKFDPDRGNKFTTYAYPWILNKVQREVERTRHSALISGANFNGQKDRMTADRANIEVFNCGHFTTSNSSDSVDVAYSIRRDIMEHVASDDDPINSIEFREFLDRVKLLVNKRDWKLFREYVFMGKDYTELEKKYRIPRSTLRTKMTRVWKEIENIDT